MDINKNLPLILRGVFFEVCTIKDGKVDAKCKECEKSGIAKIVQGSIKPTSNFTSHLKVHVEQYHNCQELMKNPLNKVKNHNKQQTTLPYSRTVIPAKSTKAENLVTNYIIDAMCPLSTVENSSFKNLISGLSDGNKCPSLKKLHLLITERYNNYVSSLIRDLSRIKYYCLTADVWSSRRRSFLGVTIHWLGEKLERHSSVLALRRFKGTHDFERINDTLQQIMSDFELVRDKITCIVTDNGSNFVKAFKEYGIDYQTEDEISESEEEIDLLDREEFVSQILLPSHQRCASHTLSLVATTDLNNANIVTPRGQVNFKKVCSSSLSKCNTLWNISSRSTKVAEQIKDLCGKALIRPVITRWNSTFDSIRTLLEVRPHLSKIFEIAGVTTLEQSWIFLANMYMP